METEFDLSSSVDALKIEYNHNFFFCNFEFQMSSLIFISFISTELICAFKVRYFLSITEETQTFKCLCLSHLISIYY